MNGNIIKFPGNAINNQNNRGVDDFEGYGPLQMDQIQNWPFGSDMPVKINPDGCYAEKIPMVTIVHDLLCAIDGENAMKLTAAGNLPTAVVKKLYGAKLIVEDNIEWGIVKLRTEQNSIIVMLARFLAQISKMIKKSNNRLTLTREGKKCIEDKNKLFAGIMNAFVNEFHWGCFDAYDMDQIGKFGVGFSMILLNKYGGDFKTDKFYAEKYFKAFPSLLNYGGAVGDRPCNCYSIRTFDRFLYYFGFVEISKELKPYAEKFVRKTALFDEAIIVAPPAGM